MFGKKDKPAEKTPEPQLAKTKKEKVDCLVCPGTGHWYTDPGTPCGACGGKGYYYKD